MGADYRQSKKKKINITQRNTIEQKLKCSAYLSSSSELASETEGSLWNSLGGAELRGSITKGLSKVACSFTLGDKEPVSSTSGFDCLVGELAEPDSPLLYRARLDGVYTRLPPRSPQGHQQESARRELLKLHPQLLL